MNTQTTVWLIVLFLLLAACASPAVQSDIDPCILDWDTMTWEEREVCAEPYGGVSLAEGTVIAIKQQTADARPTQSLESIQATEHAMWVEAGRPTPVPTPVPGVIPDGWEVVEPYNEPRARAPMEHSLRPYDLYNGWWVGATIGDAGQARRLLLAAVHPTRWSPTACGLALIPSVQRGPNRERLLGHKEEVQIWTCPEDQIILRVTEVTGTLGIVSFTTQFDQTGTFNLATEEWTLEGEPWVAATATPTASPTATPTPRPTRAPRPPATATAPPPTPTIPPFPTTATLTEALEFVRVRAPSASSFAARDYTHAVVAFWNTRPADRDQLLAFLDADQRSRRWPPPTQPLTGTLVAEADLNQDQRNDVVLIVPTGPNRLVVLIQDQDGSYHLRATADQGFATRIWHMGDINADGIPEILLQDAGCGRGSCRLYVDVVQWDGTGFTSLARDEWPDGTVEPFLSMRYAQASLQDSDGDGVQEIVLTGGDATADEARRRTNPPDIGQNVARGPQRSRTETYTWDGSHYTLAQRTYDPVASQHPWFRLHDGNTAMDAGDLVTAIDLYRDGLSRPYPQGVPNDTTDPTEQAAIMALLRFRLLLALLLTGDTDAAVAHYQAVQAEDEMAARWQRVFWLAYQENGNLWYACNVAVAQEMFDQRIRFRTFTNQYYDIYAAELLCPERVPFSLLPNPNTTAAPTPTIPPAARAAPIPQLVSPEITLPLTDTLHAVTFATAQHGWLSDGTTLLHTTDGGVDWTTVFTAETPITALDFVSSGQGWSLRNGRLWQTADAGTTWQPLTTPLDGTIEQIDRVDLRHGWIGGLDQLLWATDDGGQTWTRRPVPCDLTPDIGAVRLVNQATGLVWQPMHLSFTSPTEGFIVCENLPTTSSQDNLFYRTTDGGQTWRLRSPEGSASVPYNVLADIHAIDYHHVWVIQPVPGYAPDTLLARSDDGGLTWERLEIPHDVPEWSSVPLRGFWRQLHFLTPERGYGIMIPPDDPPTLLGTRDGGESWYRAYQRRGGTP